MPSGFASPDDFSTIDDIEQLNELGLAHLRQGDYPLAVKAFRRATYLAPLDGRLWYNLGVAYDMMGDLASARDVFQGLTVRKPDFALAWSYVGWIALQQTELEESVRAFIIATSLDPQLIENLFRKLRNALGKRDYARVASTAKWIMGAVLGDTEMLSRILSVFHNEGASQGDGVSLAELEEELRLLAKAIQKANTTKVRVEAGVWLSKEYDIDSGLGAIKTALTQDARNVEGWVQLGTLALQYKMLDEAEQAFKQGLTLDPENISAQVGLGAALMEKNVLSEAETILRRALKQDHENWQGWARLSKILLLQARSQKDPEEKILVLKEAQTAIETAIRINPENAQLYVRLADVAEEQGDQAHARKALQDAIRIDPFDALSLRRLAAFEDQQAE